MKYAKATVKKIFNYNILDPIDVQEFSEILCNGKFMKESLVLSILEKLDSDGSDSITFYEMMEGFIEYLDL